MSTSAITDEIRRDGTVGYEDPVLTCLFLRKWGKKADREDRTLRTLIVVPCRRGLSRGREVSPPVFSLVAFCPRCRATSSQMSPLYPREKTSANVPSEVTAGIACAGSRGSPEGAPGDATFGFPGRTPDKPHNCAECLHSVSVLCTRSPRFPF